MSTEYVKLIRSDNKDSRIYDLYYNHHSTPDYLLVDYLSSESVYFLVQDLLGNIIGMTSYKILTKNIMLTEKTIIYPKFRGKGFGKEVSRIIENRARKLDFTKITCEVYHFNSSMLNIKLKQGFVIEAFLKDHDGIGNHCYLVSKWLK